MRTVFAAVTISFLLTSPTCASDISLSSAKKEFVRKQVEKQFGSFDQPVFDKAFPRKRVASDTATQQALRSRFLLGKRIFAMQCAKCHGLTGDGNGQAAAECSPRPRDFRQGRFKWKTTYGNSKPTRHDLLETLRIGVPGTRMRSFSRMTKEESHAVVDYVRWLSLRGEFEYRLKLLIAVEDTDAKTISDMLESLTKQWTDSDRKQNKAVPKGAFSQTSASVARGKKLFLGGRAQCFLCHGVDGKGGGPQTTIRQRDPNSYFTGRRYFNKPGLHDDWGKLIRPRDLTKGVFRGGSGSLDLYLRIRHGIHGSPMPPSGTLHDSEIWDLVAFVNSLSSKVERGPKRRGQSPRRHSPATTPDAARQQSRSHAVRKATTNLGQLRGRITYVGQPPVKTFWHRKGNRPADFSLSLFRDHDIPRETLVVDSSTKGIANVVVYFVRRPPGYRNAKTPKTALITIQHGRFRPRVTVVQTDQTIRVVNRDKTTHNVHVLPKKNDRGPNKQVPPEGAIKFSFKRPEPRPVKIVNDIFHWMVAWQLPLDHPFAAVTDQNGEYSIRGIPSGRHEIVLWHESAGVLFRGMTEIKSGTANKRSFSFNSRAFQ